MATFVPRHDNLVSLFADSVSRYGARPLFGTKTQGEWRWITYAEFGAIVDRCRGGLSRLGVGRGDRVAIISNNRVEWAAGAYAAYGLGAAWVPMYEAQQEREWRFIINDSGAKVVFAAKPAIAALLEAARPQLPSMQRVVCLDAPASDPHGWTALLAEGARHPTPAEPAAPSSIAAFVYTAGTTGRPKGVLLSHSNLASNVCAGLEVFPLRPSHRSLSFLPWAHSFGQTTELHTLIGAGASLAICEGIPSLLANLAEVKPSVLMAVPNIFNLIYERVRKQIAGQPAIIRRLFRLGMDAQSKVKRGEALTLGEKLALPLARRLVFRKIVGRFGGRLEFAICGGAALSREVAEFVDNLGVMVCEGYGLTETSPVVGGNTPLVRRIGSVGKPLPGVTVRVDESETGAAGEGELIVYGHNVMVGYHNLNEENAKAFTADGGLRTGDLGRVDDDGFLYVTGRLKELYKLDNGKYVAPTALENQLQLSPFILQAMVFGADKPGNVAIIVPEWPNVFEWAREKGLAATDRATLANDAKVRALLADEIRRQSSGWRGYEQIRDFFVATAEFDVANDLLTPKLSMKRRNVAARYAAELDAMTRDLPRKMVQARAGMVLPPVEITHPPIVER